MLPLARALRLDHTWLALGFVFACMANEQRVTQYPAVRSGSDGAFLDCPCIQTESIAFAAAGTDNVPKDYGFYCRAWDQNSTDCAAPDAPEYCARDWCYVNQTQCKRKSVVSGKFRQPDDRLKHYSYQTCGDINFYTRYDLVEPPDGFYNGLLYNGLGRWQPDSIRQYAKVVTEYTREMLDRMGINPDSIKHRATTNASKSLYSSSFTAMAYDIALGHLHFGFYCFWQTAERIDMGISPIPLYQDKFHFWTPRLVVKEDSFWDLMAAPFRPFSLDLWLLIFGTVLFAAVNLAFVEYGVKHVCQKPSRILGELYHAFISLFSGGLTVPRDHPAARVIALGFSVFIVVIIASFTGSTASFLVGREIPRVATFEDALRSRDLICYHKVIGSALTEIYPVMSEIGVPVGWTTTSILEQIQSGVCKHAIASDTEIEQEISCSFVKMGTAIVTIPVGPFVSKEFGNVFLHRQAKLRETGVWGSYRTNLFDPYPCSVSDDDDSDTMQLDSTHMIGICIILAVCSLTSLVLHLCYVAERELEHDGVIDSKLVKQIDAVIDDGPQEKREADTSLDRTVQVSDNGEKYVASHSLAGVAPTWNEEHEQKVSGLLRNLASGMERMEERMEEMQLTMQNVKASVEVLEKASIEQKDQVALPVPSTGLLLEFSSRALIDAERRCELINTFDQELMQTAHSSGQTRK